MTIVAARHCGWALIAAGLSASALAQAQNPPVPVAAERAEAGWPSHSIRLVVPFAPGGSADTLGRLVGQKLSESLNTPVAVENRGGAGGVIGAAVVAKSAPDGYTLVVSGIGSHVLAPAMMHAPFDPVRDFSHIALFGGPPDVLCISGGEGNAGLPSFVNAAKQGAVVFGSPGPGTQAHLLGEMFGQAASLKLVHVPYKGAGPAIADLMAGHLPSAIVTLTAATTQIQAGKIRALAVSGKKRLPDLPAVPTFAESGYPDLVATVWFALSGPAGIPTEIVNRLNGEVRKILAEPEVRKRLAIEGVQPNNMDAMEFTQFVRDEVARWTPAIRSLGLVGG